jgi:Methyltransferase domain
VATPSGAADEATGLLRLHWFQQMLARFPVGRLIDLGAGHGMFARLAADAGWTVTALDARGDRYPDDRRIEWVIGDVREFDLNGFDLIACLGLFYHLTIDDQLELLARSAGTPLILDTHVANDRPTPVRLTARVTQNGYFGRLYKEPDPVLNSTAAWGNEASFWPDLLSLYRMLDEYDYDVLTATPWYLPSRTFFLCLPRSGNRYVVPPTDEAELRAAIDEAMGEARRQHDRARAVQRELKSSRTRILRLREQLDETHGSYRWRVGGIFTRPAGAIRRRIRR